MIVKKFIEQTESVYFSLDMKICFSIEILKQMRKMVDVFGVAFGIRLTVEPSLHTVRGFCTGMRKLNAAEGKDKQTGSMSDSIFII